MNRKPMILGVTPARGGSKSVPRKNLKAVAGKPLITWTIGHAKASRLLGRYVVSTEDPEITRTAHLYGTEVLDRPEELATDTADTLPVLQHALERIPAEIVVLLQCTSPVRSQGLIDRCIERFLAEKADCLGTVYEDRSFEYGQEMPRRQEIKPRLLDIGNVYVIKADLIRTGTTVGPRLISFPVTREEAVEIDEPFDLWLAEKILLERAPA